MINLSVFVPWDDLCYSFLKNVSIHRIHKSDLTVFHNDNVKATCTGAPRNALVQGPSILLCNHDSN
jgi:hypothetical protein